MSKYVIFCFYRYHYYTLILLALLLLSLVPAHPLAKAAQPPDVPDLFGLNIYITGRERGGREARDLADLVLAGHVRRSVRPPGAIQPTTASTTSALGCWPMPIAESLRISS